MTGRDAAPAVADAVLDPLQSDALFPEVIAAHCLWCPELVRGFDPLDVHDRMETHYADDHRPQIEAALDLVR